MKHLDLFSGIGGFSYALDQLAEAEHIFVEYDPFCQAVLRKHWPHAPIYGDIRTFITDAEHGRYLHGESQEQSAESSHDLQRQPLTDIYAPFILTGGFPCQPFSQAGRRKGTADDRYLWPAMFDVIRATKPTWVIAENVRGLVTWNEGMVLEQVCTDLESEGYEVQPFIIPAVAVNAPHRRDRLWIIASDTTNDDRGTRRERRAKTTIRAHGYNEFARSSWDTNWLEVATRLCGVSNELPAKLDRNKRLKALGNAIVPQVAMEILASMFK